jgi:hypothetical protein
VPVTVSRKVPVGEFPDTLTLSDEEVPVAGLSENEAVAPAGSPAVTDRVTAPVNPPDRVIVTV